MAEKWFVSRQLYWPDGECVVEIAKGGLDYANADMLASMPEYRTLGCDQEYTDPRDAVNAAIKIRDEWKKHTTEDIRIEHGFTGGYTLIFCAYPSDVDLKSWANSIWLTLEKCDRCGEVLGDDVWTICDLLPDFKFCREYCAEEAYADLMKETVEDEVLTRSAAIAILEEAIAEADNGNELPVVDIGDIHERVLAAKIIEEDSDA